MVGVAGKSKGCSTCRRRKKGCDLARPACGQCLKGGHVCGGYRRDLTFIHHKLPGKNSTPSPAPPASPPQVAFDLDTYGSTVTFSDGGSPQSSDAYGHSSVSSLEDTWGASSALVKRSSPQPPSLQVLSPTLTLTALTTLHTSLFNSVFLPRNSFAIQESTGILEHPASWTQFAPSMLNNDTSLQFAFLALSSSRIGQERQDDNLLASSRIFYGKALREMRCAILDPKRRYKEETLLACSTLGLYELFEAQAPASAQLDSSPNGWLSHVAGITRLLQVRGPESYTTDKRHQVFLHVRIISTIRASTARKRSFLSEPQWLSVPWQNHPKNMLHKLVDVMVFLPSIFEGYDDVETSIDHDPDETRRKRQCLFLKCVDLSAQLERWYTRFCAEAKGRPLWHTSMPDDPLYPFPHLFSFDDPQVAYTMMIYWTCSLVIREILYQTQHELSRDIPDICNTKNLPNYVEPGYFAVNIAQTLTYFMHPDMAGLGPSLALFPLGMAFSYYVTPIRPAFGANWKSIRPQGPMLDEWKQGKGVPIDESTTDIIVWFIKLFTQLNSRSLPGGTFLSSLMRSVGDIPAHSAIGSILEVWSEQQNSKQSSGLGASRIG